MTVAGINDFPVVWVKVLNKGLITIPKTFREALDIREGEVARVRLSKRKLIIEPLKTSNFEVYADEELSQMLKDDRLSGDLAKKAASFWPDLK